MINAWNDRINDRHPRSDQRTKVNMGNIFIADAYVCREMKMCAYNVGAEVHPELTDLLLVPQLVELVFTMN